MTALALFLSLLGPAGVQLTAQQIADKAVERNAFGFTNAQARIVLAITSAGGNERKRDVEIRAMDKSGRQKTVARFLAPADVKGTAFLVVGQKDAEDQQYLYIPALGKTKRITGSQRNQKFMGTDFTYADLEWSDLKKAHLTRKEDGTTGGNKTFVLEAVAKDPDASQYGRTITHIHQDSFVPLKVEFFDKQNRPLKTLLVKRLEKRDGKWVAMETHMKNVQEGSETRMTVLELDTKAVFDDSQFTEQALAGG